MIKPTWTTAPAKAPDETEKNTAAKIPNARSERPLSEILLSALKEMIARESGMAQ